MTCLFATETAEMLGTSRPVRGPLKRLWDSVNSHLQFYYKKNAIPPQRGFGKLFTLQG